MTSDTVAGTATRYRSAEMHRELASCFVAWTDIKDGLGLHDWSSMPGKARLLLDDHEWIVDAVQARHKAVVVADVHAMTVAEMQFLDKLLHGHPSVVYTVCPDKVVQMNSHCALHLCLPPSTAVTCPPLAPSSCS